MAGEHLVGDEGEAVDVAAGVDGAARELLGAHVPRRADDGAAQRELRRVAGPLLLGDPEVAHFDEVGLVAARGEQDVVGLEIAVHDAARVRFAQRTRDLRDDAIHAREGHRSRGERVGERRALHELHHDEQAPVLELPEIVELDRVRVREPDDDLALPIEALAQRLVAAVRRVQNLDRDVARRGAELLLGEVHAPHAAFAEHAHDAVAAGEAPSDQRIGPGLAQARTAAQTELGSVAVLLMAAGAADGHRHGGRYHAGPPGCAREGRRRGRRRRRAGTGGLCGLAIDASLSMSLRRALRAFRGLGPGSVPRTQDLGPTRGRSPARKGVLCDEEDDGGHGRAEAHAVRAREAPHLGPRHPREGRPRRASVS
ncbi:MAG TPA: hypothetical protein VIL20_16170, partial [Sandaracinaceae bacterium]